MKTINISLPDKLKDQADRIIAAGYYASFSDLVRTAIREIFSKQLEAKNFSEIKLNTPLGND